MTRIIAQYIAQGYMVEKGQPNPALEDAAKLSMDEVEAAFLGAAPATRVKDNGIGSYERFMGALGATGGRKPGQ